MSFFSVIFWRNSPFRRESMLMIGFFLLETIYLELSTVAQWQKESPTTASVPVHTYQNNSAGSHMKVN